ncbi:tRNA uridine 5-carboxymethylaminomethyl modification enzyme MnmG [Peptococcaceae bacterium CEB3]|nr:tRNA uridine 5-carboxymethylaminomethyl modification enzyme MnmG [Peptococcaceae bacterium CEB3]
MPSKIVEQKNYDVVIVGGGMSGVCAAIASARHGAKTALIQNRPVLGGNASSEIRMHICGADSHGTRANARETGILEEILLENRKRNYNNSFSIFDTILWEKTRFQDGLDLFLNTHMTGVEVIDSRIKKIKAEQMTTEKVFEIEGKVFMDATGDGTLAVLSGAEYMTGREGKDVFGEQYAPEVGDEYTMGNTLLFKAVDMGRSVPYQKPLWANTYTEEDLAYRQHVEISAGYWWIELGGEALSTIADGEEIRDELLKAVYGVWDHIKNSGHHNADNFALDWVGFLPGKRESRRITGDYILKEQDCLTGQIFDDAVAYGGWPMDMHVVGGLTTRLEPNRFIHLNDVYTIPYRSLYSRNISNLLIGGRAISASHMAFGSTRITATCAVVGQAGGTAAALAVERGILPRDVGKHTGELQQTLMKDDCYIPGFKNDAQGDIARLAKVSCSTSVAGCDCIKVINGISRNVGNEKNCWISEDISPSGEWISLEFGQMINPRQVHLKFDSNLSKEVMISLSHSVLSKQTPGIPGELVRDYSIEFYRKDEMVYNVNIEGNYKRHCILEIGQELLCDKMKINVRSTNGDKKARIFEVRVYEKRKKRSKEEE